MTLLVHVWVNLAISTRILLRAPFTAEKERTSIYRNITARATKYLVDRLRDYYQSNQ